MWIDQRNTIASDIKKVTGDIRDSVTVGHSATPPLNLKPIKNMQTIDDLNTVQGRTGKVAIRAIDVVKHLENALVNDRDLPHTDFEEIRKMLNDITDLGIRKDREYGASWCKRLGPGAFFTIWRKIDRLETQCEKLKYDVFNVEGDPHSTESLDETLLDAVFYFALLLQKRATKKRMIADLMLAQADEGTRTV
jgi:hypothetical protein